VNTLTHSKLGILTPDQRVRVFVSSTLNELAEERTAVRQAISDLRLNPVVFESGARPYPPRSVYSASIDQSHVYVGIFWQSYGWVAPDMKISGIEDEYNLSENKPRLVYVKAAPQGRDPRLAHLLERITSEAKVCYRPFASIDELVEFVKDDLVLLLSERFELTIRSHESPAPPSYLQSTKREVDQHGIIAREAVTSAFKRMLDTSRRVVVHGEPGAGKTVLLASVGEESDAIYISLRNKTVQQVCSHLANHLMVRRNQFPRMLPSEDDARAALQEQLANSNAVIFIDDADQNASVTQALLGLDFFDCKVAFATRVIDAPLYQGLARFEIPRFERTEIETYLQSHGVSLGPGEFQTLVSASNGNPLYLFYFTQYQISPLPEGLASYQEALWSRLTAPQQEVMSLLSLAITQLDAGELHDILRESQAQTSAMETLQIIESTSPLIRNTAEGYEFFHPYFEEYVRSVIEDAELGTIYHRRLGEFAGRRNWVVSAAYHYLRAGDPRLEEFLWEGARAAALRGSWRLAEELICRQIEWAQHHHDQNKEAQARHLLAEQYLELGLYRKAQDELAEAQKLYEALGNEEWKELVVLESSMLLIEDGRAEETVTYLVSAVEKYRDEDPVKEAVTQINLSYAYIRLSKYREGADSARRALELFTNQNDERGIYTSLLNLAGCIGRLGDNELQRTYANQLLEASDKGGLLRLKAAGLNLLASAQRRLHDPASAQHNLEKCIEICQTLGSVDLELLNIGNLGNALRDQGLSEKAESAYVEVLTKAREHNLPRHEGSALEHLARMRFEEGLYDESIELGFQALAFHKKLDEHIRIAETEYYIARSFVGLAEKEKAADHYEVSGEHYAISGALDDAAYSYDQAASIWNSLKQWERASKCVTHGIEAATSGKLPNRLEGLLYEAKSSKTPRKLGDTYLETLRLYIEQSSGSFTSFILSFASFCKNRQDVSEKEQFKASIELLLEAIKQNPSGRLLNALAVAIEQARSDILQDSSLSEVIRTTTGALEHLHCRQLPDGSAVWTIGLKFERVLIVRIHCFEEGNIALRVAAALSILLAANADKIDTTLREFGGNQEDGFELHIFMEETLSKPFRVDYLSKDQADQNTPATIAASAVPYDQPQPPATIILDQDYENVACWATSPGNKAFVWVVMNAFSLLVAHCTHQRFGEGKILPKRAREFCEGVLK
jgi:uncharacterized protein DUF4062/AAA domain-containing protein